VWWVGDDFWYSSMRSPSTTPSPSELSTLSKKIAPQKSEATRPGGEGVRRIVSVKNSHKLNYLSEKDIFTPPKLIALHQERT